MKTYYSIRWNCEYKVECQRCGRPLQTAVVFLSDGVEITVGRECAKHYGIEWTDKIGPMADDPETYNQAVEIFRNRNDDERHQWPGGWEKCNLVKIALGYKAWKKAMWEAYYHPHYGH